MFIADVSRRSYLALGNAGETGVVCIIRMIVDISRFACRPISSDEWLPDRCLGGGKPFDPKANQPESGCASLDEFYTHGIRKKLEGIYRKAINDS